MYGDEKTKQMVRSILPSRWRGAARAKSRVRRAERRAVRMALRGACSDAVPDAVDLRRDDRVEIGFVVDRRRSADKLNHFIRWARARTEHLPIESRLSAMRALLPKGLIGEHALFHLAWDDHFQPEYEHARRYEPYRWETRARLRLGRVLPDLVGCWELRTVLNRALQHAHEPSVWNLGNDLRTGDPVVLRELSGPTQVTQDTDLSAWVETLARAHRPGRNRYIRAEMLGLEGRPVGHRLRVEKSVMVLESGGWCEVPGGRRGQYVSNPNSHREWIQTAVVVASLWESGWRSPRALEEALEDPVLVARRLRAP